MALVRNKRRSFTFSANKALMWAAFNASPEKEHGQKLSNAISVHEFWCIGVKKFAEPEKISDECSASVAMFLELQQTNWHTYHESLNYLIDEPDDLKANKRFGEVIRFAFI